MSIFGKFYAPPQLDVYYEQDQVLSMHTSADACYIYKFDYYYCLYTCAVLISNSKSYKLRWAKK